ncbi:MAG: HTH domain-containing protein, partial [Candidatus Hodarchaeota archaeon]
DTVGESILISNTEDEKDNLMNLYILGEPEPIKSRLIQESILRTHILALIARGTGLSKKGIEEFIGKTFLAHQSIFEDFYSIIDSVIDFLLEEKLIEEKINLLIPTKLGKRISQLYIDPKSGIILKNAILIIKDIDINTVGILHLISRTEDIPKLYLRKKDYEELMQFVNKHLDEFLFEIEDEQDYEWLLSEMKVTSLMYLWINELDENTITSKFGVGSGDIHRYVELYNWLIYALHEIAKLYKKTTLKKFIKNLQLRIKYGIKKELLELVSLKGIGRVRARILFDHGYTSINSLKRARSTDLMKLDYFGPESIKSIYEQIGVTIGKLTPDSTKDKLKLNQKSIDDYI